MDKKIFERLGRPFPARDVLWRIQKVSKKNPENGLAVPYLDARAIADRLDEVVGQGCWHDDYKMWHNYKALVKEDGKSYEKNVCSQLCILSVYDDERKEWVSKSDAAENSNFEPIKGGISDSFKRAAVKWNIGRYLYKLDPVWVKIDEYKEIIDTEQERLKTVYYNAVARIFGKETCEKLKAEETASPQPKAKATAKENAKPQETAKAGENKKANSPIYEVSNVSVNEGMNGKNSTLILSIGGKQYKAFMRGKDDRLKVGAKITNIKTEQIQNTMGKYTILSGFDMAA